MTCKSCRPPIESILRIMRGDGERADWERHSHHDVDAVLAWVDSIMPADERFRLQIMIDDAACLRAHRMATAD